MNVCPCGVKRSKFIRSAEGDLLCPGCGRVHSVQLDTPRQGQPQALGSILPRMLHNLNARRW